MGRATVFEVSPQSRQFRSSDQKAFYLLNQMLCRTKCQAGFKAEKRAEPQAPSTVQQAPARRLSSRFARCRPQPLLPTLSVSFEGF